MMKSNPDRIKHVVTVRTGTWLPWKPGALDRREALEDARVHDVLRDLALPRVRVDRDDRPAEQGRDGAVDAREGQEVVLVAGLLAGLVGARPLEDDGERRWKADRLEHEVSHRTRHAHALGREVARLLRVRHVGRVDELVLAEHGAPAAADARVD